MHNEIHLSSKTLDILCGFVSICFSLIGTIISITSIIYHSKYNNLSNSCYEIGSKVFAMSLSLLLINFCSLILIKRFNRFKFFVMLFTLNVLFHLINGAIIGSRFKFYYVMSKECYNFWSKYALFKLFAIYAMLSWISIGIFLTFALIALFVSVAFLIKTCLRSRFEENEPYQFLYEDYDI